MNTRRLREEAIALPRYKHPPTGETAPTVVCDLMLAAADEIDRLRAEVAGHAAAVESAYVDGYTDALLRCPTDRARLASSVGRDDWLKSNSRAALDSKPATPAPAQREGKVCGECKGIGTLPLLDTWSPRWAVIPRTCPSCNGTGRQP